VITDANQGSGEKETKMKKIAIWFTIFVGLTMIVSLSPCFAPIQSEALAQDARKVLVIPREGYSQDLDLMISKEFNVILAMLKKAGYQTTIATTSGASIISPTTTIKPDLILSAVKVDEYAGVIMPCMAVGMYPGPPVSPETVSIVKQALAADKPVAAATGSVIILADAGLLKGKEYAYAGNPLETTENRKRTDSRFDGGIFKGVGVVQDGNIITSGACPYMAKAYNMKDCTTEITNVFVSSLSSKK
jgi:putative intracellular protease/amidase